SFTHNAPRPIGVPPGRSVANSDRFTIIFKQSSKNRRQYNFRYDIARECFEVNGTNDLLNKTMEDLAQCDNVRPNATATNAEMERLQKRLLETESAMQKILSQLDTLSQNFDTSKAETLKRDTEDTLRKFENTLKDEKTCDTDFFEKNASVDDAISSDELYIRDLDKAFADFRHFTDAYLKDKGRSLSGKDESFADSLKKLYWVMRIVVAFIRTMDSVGVILSWTAKQVLQSVTTNWAQKCFLTNSKAKKLGNRLVSYLVFRDAFRALGWLFTSDRTIGSGLESKSNNNVFGLLLMKGKNGTQT
uniref:Uncharacterized protein n=1 Tax=Romanomermis culicivorax TaxID=13658 RepID=A0A915IP07_ROMCU